MTVARKRTHYEDGWRERAKAQRGRLIAKTQGSEDCGRPSHARYVQGCRCARCKEANAAYERERQRRKARVEWGEKPAFVDAAPVRERLLELRAMGYTVKEIERISGVGHTEQYQITVRHWRSGKPVRKVKRKTAEAVMAIEPGKRRLSAGQRVPGTWMGCKVRGWKDAGLSVARISRETGIDRQVLDRVSRRYGQRVEAATLHKFVLSTPKVDAIAQAMLDERRGFARKGGERG